MELDSELVSTELTADTKSLVPFPQEGIHIGYYIQNNCM